MKENIISLNIDKNKIEEAKEKICNELGCQMFNLVSDADTCYATEFDMMGSFIGMFDAVNNLFNIFDIGITVDDLKEGFFNEGRNHINSEKEIEKLYIDSKNRILNY